jgi:hypothetical protein
MPEEPGTQLLLESILSTQREAAAEMRRLTSTMATKEDITNLTRAMEDTIVRREYDEYRATMGARVDGIETRVKTLEYDKLPKWFWPTLAALAGVVSPIVTTFIIHWPHQLTTR